MPHNNADHSSENSYLFLVGFFFFLTWKEKIFVSSIVFVHLKINFFSQYRVIKEEYKGLFHIISYSLGTSTCAPGCTVGTVQSFSTGFSMQ